MKRLYSTLALISFLSFLYIFSPQRVFGDNSRAISQNTLEQPAPTKDETLEGRVVHIAEEKQVAHEGIQQVQLYQKIQILITKGSLKGKTVTIENGKLPMSNVQKYLPNDEVVIARSKDYEGKDTYFITDYVRRGALSKLFFIFVVMAILVGKWQGVTSLIGMSVSFFVIFQFILPKISLGNDPIYIAILGSLMIIPATFFLSHGINRKTIIAIIGTLISLIITGILANYFVQASQLTGFASEEAGFLQSFKPGIINIQGLLLAGIIIGVLGILDDITISQSAIVSQLKETNPNLSPKDIYTKAMSVGKDHVASMVNTLILVYTGASLPLLLLFIDNPHPFTELINYEFIADEIVRTLVGSIGLILAVPITTLIAAFYPNKYKRK